MRGFLIGLVIGLLILPIGVWWWFHYGHPPVAVADHSLPFEKSLARTALHARIDHELPPRPVMQPTPTNLLLGAQVFRQNCAACHGLYGHPSEYGPNMFPSAPQMWKPHGNGVVGVSDDPVGETWWKVQNGIRLSGMPSFGHTLNKAQIWQVSLLLANADKPLPDNVMAVLKQPLDFAIPAPQPAAPAETQPAIPVQPLPNE